MDSITRNLGGGYQTLRSQGYPRGVNRVPASLLLLLPLGCHGTFDISKYIIADDEADESQGDTLGETTLGETESTSGHTTTESESDTTVADATGDTDVGCSSATVDIGTACIGVKQTIDVMSAAPLDLAVADFSGDGVFDLLTATGLVDIRLGGVNGMFEGASTINTASGYAIASGNFGLDPLPDFLVVANSQITLFQSLGEGGFVLLGEIDVLDGYDAVIADIDGDVDGDVVLSGDSLHVFNNDAVWTPVVDSPAYPGNDLLLAQLDADEDLDLALARTDAKVLSLFTNPGTGNFFTVPVDYNLDGIAGIAVADLDEDGTLEILVLDAFSNTLQVLQVLPSLDTIQHSVHLVGEEPHRVAVGDLDADDHVDVVVGNSKTHDVSLLLGDGTTLGADFRVGDDPADVPGPIVMADLDDDGRDEFIVGMSVTNQIVVFGHVLGD
jgi:hypothetical protein